MITVFRRPLPLFPTLFGILVFFLPFQQRLQHPFKSLARHWFSKTPFLPSFFDRSVGYYLTDFLMIGLLFVGLSQLQRKRQIIDSLTPRLFLSGFLLVAALSITQSRSAHAVWPYFIFIQFSVSALLGAVLVGREDWKQLFIVFCWVMAVTSALQSLIGIAQYFMQERVGLKELGEQFLTRNFSSHFPMPNGARWIFDRFSPTQHSLLYVLRAAGTLPHPNILGAFLAVALICTSWLFLQVRKGAGWLGMLMLLQIFVLFLTYSRAALFGWLVAMGFFCWLCRREHRIKWLVGLMTLLLLVCGAVLYDQLLHRGGVINYNSLAEHSDHFRIIYQQMAWKMACDHPLLGVGWSHFLVHMEGAAPPNLPPNLHFQTVHNIYMLILSETGFLGLLLFGLFVGMPLLLLFKRGLVKERIPLFVIWIFLLGTGLLDHYHLTAQQGRMLFFISLGLLYAALGKKTSPVEVRPVQQ